MTDLFASQFFKRGLSFVALPGCILTLLAGCNDQPDSSSAAQSATALSGGPFGVYERRYLDAVGQSYLDVLVLGEDNRYATFMRGASPDDSGTFTLADKAISFNSEIDARYSQSLSYEFIDELTLRLRSESPFPNQVDWVRSTLRPFFNSAIVAGESVPEQLPQLVGGLLQSRALSWQQDALPTSVEVREAPAGRFDIQVLFFSPATGRALRLTIDHYTIRTDEIDGSRLPQVALPTDFFDLPQILSLARQAGLSGGLRSASLRVYEQAGPVWGVSPHGPRGANYSALSGERIEGDVTGYIAQYEADWQRIGEIWSHILESQAPKPEFIPSNAPTWCLGCITIPGTCSAYGGFWDSDQGKCNK